MQWFFKTNVSKSQLNNHKQAYHNINSKRNQSMVEDINQETTIQKNEYYGGSVGC
jgi:Neuraminidase (sialidase)